MAGASLYSKWEVFFMADENMLVNTDNENGTQSASWVASEDVTSEQKVLIGRRSPLSGNMVATWEPMPEPPVTDLNGKFGTTPAEFDMKKNVIKIDISSGVTSLAGSVFNGATNLTEVNIPDTVTAIGNSAFNGCTSLAELELPPTLTSIGSYCFEGCTSLSSLDIPSTVTSIGTSAFNRCSALETITIHKEEGSITGAPWGAPQTTAIVWAGE